MPRIPDKPCSPRPSWSVRHRTGRVRELESLGHLARLIVEGQLEQDAEISAGGDWKPLQEVVDTHTFTATLRALGHIL